LLDLLRFPSTHSQVEHIVGCVFVSVAVRQAADSEMLLPRLPYYTNNDIFFMYTMFTFTLMVQLYVVAVKHDDAGFVEYWGTNSSDWEPTTNFEMFASGIGRFFFHGDTGVGDFMKFLQASAQTLWIGYNAYTCIFSKGFHFVWRFDTSVWFLIERSKRINGVVQGGGEHGAIHRFAQVFRFLSVIGMMLLRSFVFLACTTACAFSMSFLLPPDTMWYNNVRDSGQWVGLILLAGITFVIVFTETVALGCCDIIDFISRQCVQRLRLKPTERDRQRRQLGLAFGDDEDPNTSYELLAATDPAQSIRVTKATSSTKARGKWEEAVNAHDALGAEGGVSTALPSKPSKGERRRAATTKTCV
jgi:hypothetical protein